MARPETPVPLMTNASPANNGTVQLPEENIGMVSLVDVSAPLRFIHDETVVPP